MGVSTRVPALHAGCAALAVALCGGCSASPSRPGVEPIYDQQTGRLQVLRLDSDHNGKVDTISYMDGSSIQRIELDKDEDGKVERWEYYGPDQKLLRVGFSRGQDGIVDAWSYARVDGSIERIEISTARDGKVTRIEHYEHDAIAAAEEDSDGNGALDKWERYDTAGEESRLVSVSFDTRSLGRPDRRVMYEPGGAVRVEIDPDGDGTFVNP